MDEYEVRQWHGWNRHITLAMFALVYLNRAQRGSAKQEAALDQGMSYDPTTGQAKAEPVEHVFINHDTNLLDVTLAPFTTTTSPVTQDDASSPKEARAAIASHGTRAPPTSQPETLHTTTEHPFLTTDRGFVDAEKLRVGEQVRQLGGRGGVVVAVAVTPGAAVRYNLTVRNLHTFAVGVGLWVVHNTGFCPLSSASLNKASKELENGATQVTVKSKSEAEELFFRKYQGDGYRNSTGLIPEGQGKYAEIDALFGKKQGTYHWDDQLGDDGRVIGHAANNPDGDMPHLQIHTLGGPIIRIFFPGE